MGSRVAHLWGLAHPWGVDFGPFLDALKDAVVTVKKHEISALDVVFL